MSQLIIDNIETVVKSVSSKYSGGDVYFMYGHIKEVNRRLLQKGNDKQFKYQKYPLITLAMPFSTQVAKDRMVTANVNIGIMNLTDKQYYSEKRYEAVFKPILIPIYELFMNELEESGLFNVIGWPTHNRIDRLYWSSDDTQSYGNKAAQMFSDPLDAIELVNLELKTYKNEC